MTGWLTSLLFHHLSVSSVDVGLNPVGGCILNALNNNPDVILSFERYINPIPDFD